MKRIIKDEVCMLKEHFKYDGWDVNIDLFCAYGNLSLEKELVIKRAYEAIDNIVIEHRDGKSFFVKLKKIHVMYDQKNDEIILGRKKCKYTYLGEL